MNTETRKVRTYPSASWAREALVLLGVTLLLAAGTWLVRTPRLPLIADAEIYDLELSAPLVSPADAVAAYEANTHVFIDAREDVGLRRIPGALPLRPALFEDDYREIFDFVAPEDPIILVGDGNLMILGNLADRLIERGYQDLGLLRGGHDAWHAAGGPLTPAEGDAP